MRVKKNKADHSVGTWGRSGEHTRSVFNNSAACALLHEATLVLFRGYELDMMEVICFQSHAKQAGTPHGDAARWWNL